MKLFQILLKKREKNGKFKSIEDFIHRIDSKDINKLQLEGLTKAGVFDEFDSDRGKIFNSIPKIIQKIKNKNEDKDNNQTSLFENSEKLENFEYLTTEQWTQKKLLTEEFISLGFYISNHPLNEYAEVFNQLDIVSYNEFYNNNNSEGLVAGTIMSIQEKKVQKEQPYAIIKFSDKKGEFELFLFSENLINNRSKLKESESFILTLQKDRNITGLEKKRVNVRKILSLEEVINKTYKNVIIELEENFNLSEIKEILSSSGDTKINLIVKNKNRKLSYLLEKNRKFDLKHLKALKAKEYVEKITV